MGSRYGETLGEMLVKKSRGEEVELPENPKRVFLNRAEARQAVRESSRKMRKSEFGRKHR